MRPVRFPLGVTPPQDWLQEADALSAQLQQAADDNERAGLIEANQEHWRDPRIRDWLIGVHHRKCWYTEAKESVSAYHVDHFRPKGRVTESNGSTRPGYWWLAFDWRNYRISGQLINVKKRDVFPVQLPGHAQPDNLDTLKIEGCRLIDPVGDDAWLLSFERDADGECLAGPSPDVDGVDEERVRLTIDVLGLNRLKSLNRNRADVWDKCLARIQDYRSAADEPAQLRPALQAVALKALAELASAEAEFSSVAWACIEKLAPSALRRGVHDVLQGTVQLKGAA